MVGKNLFFISPNKLKIWLECPRKYWHYYIYEPTKYKEPPRPYYTLGEAVHNTLNSFFSLSPSIRTKERLFDQFKLHWHSVTNQEGGFTDKKEEKLFKDRAVAMLESFFAGENIYAVPFKLSPAKTVYIALTNKIMLGGKIDRVDLEPDGSLHIIDYKTGKEDKDDPYQLPIYDLLVRGWLKKEVSKLSYLHLESGHWSSQIPTESSRKKIKTFVLETAKEIPKVFDRKYFNCKLGKNCNHCDYLKEIGFVPILD